jgi:hypothetical protein
MCAADCARFSASNKVSSLENFADTLHSEDILNASCFLAEAPAEPPAGETAPAEEAPAEAEAGAPAPATPLKEPGFVIATTDDSSPPPVTEGSTFHHIKNFAGTEQMMNNGEVAAQGAGADFQNGEVRVHRNSLLVCSFLCLNTSLRMSILMRHRNAALISQGQTSRLDWQDLY